MTISRTLHSVSALDIIIITPSSSPHGSSSDRDAAIERRSGVVERAGAQPPRKLGGSAEQRSTSVGPPATTVANPVAAPIGRRKAQESRRGLSPSPALHPRANGDEKNLSAAHSCLGIDDDFTHGEPRCVRGCLAGYTPRSGSFGGVTTWLRRI